MVPGRDEQTGQEQTGQKQTGQKQTEQDQIGQGHSRKKMSRPSRPKQLGIAFLLSVFCSALFSGLTLGGWHHVGAAQAQAIAPGFDGHWAEPCIESLVSQNVFDQATVDRRFPNSSLTQAEFADAVLRAFPNAFATANEELGLTFEAADSETEALLMAALGDDASLKQYVGRAQALAILTSGSATPYQADATRALSSTFRDSLLIPHSAREGVAAALAAGYIVDTEAPSQVDGLRQLRARRSTTMAEGASFICRASLDSRLVATVPETKVVPFVPPAQIVAPTRELRGVWMTNIDSE
ncbi:MAG: hypothetical protein ABG776_21865, partial [Cyanobacteria bacterium J06555_13]